MKLPRRDVEVFSLSFLDCVCCGFGAIILLLVLTEFGEPIQLEQSRKDLSAQLIGLERQLHEMRGETDSLQRELQGGIEELEKQRREPARLAGHITNGRGEFGAGQHEARAPDNTV